MSQIIDRRAAGKNKSADNRRRFLRRFKKQIRKAVSDAVSGRNISDLERGEEVSIPSRDLGEPTFRHGSGGAHKQVHPGNEQFSAGDRIPRPEQGGDGDGNGGEGGSNQGEGEDDFVFELTREEFLNFFFDDLALPDMVKKQLTVLPESRKARAGFTLAGNPSNLHVVRSFRSAIGRRLAMSAGPKKKLAAAEEELDALENLGAGETPQAQKIRDEIEKLKARIAAVPFIDTFDLHYANHVDVPEPTSQAVMFCIMDVSGSMDEVRKSIAKRFFMLLHLFLTKNYERIEVVFIRHHTVAKEVEEDDFFHSRETGGTVVSSALKLAADIVEDRYPESAWNIYIAQASDGDNFVDDTAGCGEQLKKRILPFVQYYAYVEINAVSPQSLWREYMRVSKTHANFVLRRINGEEEIFPVFRELFKKETA